MTGPASHRIQRQDVILADIADDDAFWSAQSSSGVVVRHFPPSVGPRGAGRDSVLSDERLRVVLDGEVGGVIAEARRRQYYADAADATLPSACPYSSRSGANARRDLRPDRPRIADWLKSWHTDWWQIAPASRLQAATP
jgi:hypothetical protein